MLDSHRLQIERAEIQNKLNNDRLIEIRSTDTDAELRSGERKALTEQMNGVNERLIVALQQEDIETQMVTAKHVDMGSDIWTPELRELRTIAQKAEFRHYVASSISETPLQGEAREYNEQMLGSWAPGEFPIEKLLDPVEDFKPSELIGYKMADKSTEERAAIGGTFSNVGAVTWASRLFQSSEALYLGRTDARCRDGQARLPNHRWYRRSGNLCCRCGRDRRRLHNYRYGQARASPENLRIRHG